MCIRDRAQVTTGEGNLTGGIVNVTHNTGTAAHGSHFRFGTAGDIVLQVEGRVQEGVVGEQTLCADLAGKPEQIVVGVALVVVDAFLNLEDVDGEDAGLAMAQTGFQSQQDVADDHAALGGGVGTVVDGGEGSLCAGTGVHGVQVMYKALHGLLGVPVGLAEGAVSDLLQQLFCLKRYILLQVMRR